MTTFEPGARVVFTQGLRLRPFSTAFFASSAAPIITYGLEVFVQEVIAAMTTWPWSMVVSVPSSRVTLTWWVARVSSLLDRVGGRERAVQRAAAGVGGQRVAERGLGVGQLDPVLRALRAGDGRDDGGQVEGELLGEAQLAGRVVPQALRLGVLLDQVELALPGGRSAAGTRCVASSIGKIAQVEPNSGDMLPIVARLATGTSADAVAVELDELADHAVLAQHLGDREHQVGGGGGRRERRR